MAKLHRLEYWLGLLFTISIIPLGYLFVCSFFHHRPLIYFLWLSLMIFFILLELLLDYILKIDFRSIRWMTISYVTIFFAASGGMIGVASQVGKGWAYATIVTFLIMAAMAFLQHLKTGL